MSKQVKIEAIIYALFLVGIVGMMISMTFNA